MTNSRFPGFIKKNPVLTVAVGAAAVTAVFVPPDAKYIEYFDFKTLCCLFCTLAVVGALRNIDFFYILARRIVEIFKTTRAAILVLVCITFIGSMLIANDMALLTFLPLGYFVLDSTGQRRHMAFTFIMQNIAANLGGMLTPFGNPQNLYLYTKFAIPNAEFVGIMFPPFAIAVVLIIVCCMFVPVEALSLPPSQTKLKKPRAVLYSALFALSIAIVFRGVPFYIGTAVIVAALLIADRHALETVDYPLLLTFAAFFIFAGNMARIDAVRELFGFLLQKSTLLMSVLSCQVISNVPSAILLSQFTSDYPSLLIGVNIGGTGTLIASLASLITFREYTRHNPGKTGKYIAMFSLFNFGFLAVLTVSMLLLWIR